MIGHMECVRCGCEVERETDPELMVIYSWYCPACDAGRTDENVKFVENAPFEQVRWGFVDEDTIVITRNVEDVLSIAPPPHRRGSPSRAGYRTPHLQAR